MSTLIRNIRIINRADRTFEEEFTDCLVAFYRSSIVREKIAVRLGNLLSVEPEIFKQAHALYYRLTCAKMALEWHDYLSDHAQNDGASLSYSLQRSHERSRQSFIRCFFKCSNENQIANRTSLRLLQIRDAFDELVATGAVDEMGLRLLEYLEEHFEIPRRWIRQKRASQLIEIVQECQLHDV